MDFSYKTITTWFEDAIDYAFKHKKEVMVGCVGLVLLTGALLGYNHYRQYVQANAHKAFVDALRYYDAPVKAGSKTVIGAESIEFGSEKEKWEKVAELFAHAYQNHKSASIATMFGAYQADALANLGKFDEAIDILSNVIKSMPSPEMKDFYSLKLALIKLDSSKQEMQQDGFAALKKIAETPIHVANEAGLYYLGTYFWSKKDFAQAKNYWQQLMVKYGLKNEKSVSGFPELVRSHLKLISADW